MSKDIRSYFQLQRSQKPKIDDDDDVIPESPEVQIKFKKKETKKKRVLKDSDSEEEIFTSQQKKANINKKTKITSKSSKPALKEVKAVDIFGSAPIKRTEPLIKKRKKTEISIHSDDEFEKSLLEIDNDELESKIFDKFKNEPGTYSVKEMPTSSDPKTKEKTINRDTTSKVNKNKSSDTDSRNDSKISDIKRAKEQSNDTKKIGIKEEVKLNNKRKFSEFVENDVINVDNSGKKNKLDDVENANTSHSLIDDIDCSVHENHEVKEKKNKSKINKSLNDSVISDEERHERRRYSAALYKNYINRSGPKHLGSKEIPEGTPNCLKDCAFVLTGVLDSFEKDDIAAAINKYGGIVKTGVTKKVTHVIAGEDAGPAKMSKAQELGIKIINEDEFLKMIVDLSSKKSDDNFKNDIKKDKSPIKKSSKEKINIEHKSEKHNHINNKTNKSPSKSSKNDPKSSNYKKGTDLSDAKSSAKSKSPAKSNGRKKTKEEIKSEYTNGVKSENDKSCSNEITKSTSTADHDKKYSYMWVDKYKPQNVKQIIGQHGDASNVKKLTNWLTKWYVNRKAKLTKPNPWAKNDDGGYYKAALLSGPPGVGKTTTVALVCKELGFDLVEFNASDTRNKTLIKEQISELLTTTSLSAYAKGDTGKQAVTKKHVLVMDEVDGMAGNEDRGGLQELIGLIKSTSVPIICMCNDRNSQKMRTLVNYCYDLRFQRPRVDQIKSAMMSICFKEGIKIPPDVLAQLIVSANQDVRQTLNFLSMWAADPELSDVERLRKDAKSMKKDVKLGPWEAIRKVFSAEEHKTMSIHDKSDLFFYDYNLAPLFVQENYLQVAPHCPKHEVLQRLSKAADSISLGDMVDARIRHNQAWSLLPIQAMYSSVIPGNELSGHVTGQIQFPGWLGKNSRATKLHRLCQEIHAHTRLSTSGSKSSIYLDYCTHLRDAIVNPLIKDRTDGISQSLEVLESYHLLREDLESLVELSLWPGQRNPTILIDAKVKAAMTRTYNKTAVALPYAPASVKRGRARDDDGIGEEDQYQEDEPEDSDPENDALIKKKKDKDTEKATTSKSKSSLKASTSKEKKKK